MLGAAGVHKLVKHKFHANLELRHNGAKVRARAGTETHTTRVLDRVWEATEDLVMFVGEALALGVDPLLAAPALHHLLNTRLGYTHKNDRLM